MQRMKSDGFDDVEDALLQALKTSSIVEEPSGASHDERTGADLIAALQTSPYREREIEPPKMRLSTVRDVVL